ncbi:MAG: glycosyltransferase [Lachnospiraceae bacterium]
MKVLFLKWDSFGNPYIIAEFQRIGAQVICFDFPHKTEDTRGSEELASAIAKKILETNVDFVFSFNYFATAAIACKACRVKYISWTYDSPCIQLYSQTIAYDTNVAFVFDKSEYVRLRNLGLDTVHFLPMAAPVQQYGAMTPTEEQQKCYAADIAMIGSMYSEKKHHLFRHLENLDSFTKGYLDGVMEAQKKVSGVSLIASALTPEIIKNMQKVCPMIARGDGLETIEWVFSNYFIARKLTAIERQEAIAALANHYQVALYTPEKTPDLKADNRGSLDYYDQAPFAMKCAKINLNITLRSIVTGIPLRVFDVLGCGGFLLTNYQADMLDYFEPDRDYVYYDGVEDLVEKAGFYLQHEQERKRIAANGYEKVCANHTFAHRVAEILRVAGF